MSPEFYEIVEVLTPGDLRSRHAHLQYSDFLDELPEDLDLEAESTAVHSRSARSRRSAEESTDDCPASMDLGEGAFLDIPAFLRSEAHEQHGPPPWSIGFSKQFKKDTAGMDRKLLGRVLEVLEEISGYSTPFRAHGDTFKPLTGPLEGCWRYRLGDHRLVVQPLLKLAQINALTLGARGSVYD